MTGRNYLKTTLLLAWPERFAAGHRSVPRWQMDDRRLLGRGHGHERHRLLLVRQDRTAGHGRPAGHRGPGARAVPDGARLADQAGIPMPRLYISPEPAAERLRHRPQPAERRGLRSPRASCQILD